MSVAGGKQNALISGKRIKCESIQVFIRGVRSWNSNPLQQKDIDNFLEKKKELKDEIWPILSHNSYLINLASIEKEKLEKSYAAMTDEFTKAELLQIDYIVMHPGVIPKGQKNSSIPEAISRIATQINKLLADTKESKVGLLLETTAGQGVSLGHKFEHLKEIISKVKTKKRIGICFDTCHSFVAGYDFTTKEKNDDMWAEFDDEIGLDYLKAFHLNDAVNDLGSYSDRHTHIGQGKIGIEAFKLLVNDERFKDLPGILETPKDKELKEDIMNLATLRALITQKEN